MPNLAIPINDSTSSETARWALTSISMSENARPARSAHARSQVSNAAVSPTAPRSTRAATSPSFWLEAAMIDAARIRP